MTCDRCGGTLHGADCKLCELFEQGPLYDGVERCRLNNPNESHALKVHPRQVPEAVADAVRKGVPTEFTKDGRPRFTSREHQKRYLKAYGYVNLDGGYGD